MQWLGSLQGQKDVETKDKGPMKMEAEIRVMWLPTKECQRLGRDQEEFFLSLQKDHDTLISDYQSPEI